VFFAVVACAEGDELSSAGALLGGLGELLHAVTLYLYFCPTSPAATAIVLTSITAQSALYFAIKSARLPPVCCSNFCRLRMTWAEV
jgi:hypothetical protein